MSKINVDTWEPESGSAATLMATGDTVTLPDGAILAVASGGDINVASGGEIDIASGATLDVNGTIDLTGATTTGFPAGGLTAASQWRLTTDFSGDAAPIASNLEEVDAPVGFGILGSSMTESSGIFTFPSTGYWLVRFHALMEGPHPASTVNNASIYNTTDNSAYLVAAVTSAAFAADDHVGGTTTEFIFDVVSTSLCKCRFDIQVTDDAVITHGDTAKSETFMTFLRLADT